MALIGKILYTYSNILYIKSNHSSTFYLFIYLFIYLFTEINYVKT